jgi:hypothetical protein
MVADTDGDGIKDGAEVNAGFNPLDGTCGLQELLAKTDDVLDTALAYYLQTHPNTENLTPQQAEADAIDYAGSAINGYTVDNAELSLVVYFRPASTGSQCSGNGANVQANLTSIITAAGGEMLTVGPISRGTGQNTRCWYHAEVSMAELQTILTSPTVFVAANAAL